MTSRSNAFSKSDRPSMIVVKRSDEDERSMLWEFGGEGS